MKHLLTLSLFTLLSSSLLAQVTFTSSGVFVVPAGVDTIGIELVGAGGNGGTNGAGGGGGGGYARGSFVVSPGTSYSIVVGTGGSGLATIVGGLGILAGAGDNGTSVSNPNIGGGGAGGAGLGGQVARTGGAGGGGYYTYFGGGGGGAAGATSNGGVGGNTIVWNGNNCLTPGGSAGVAGGAPSGAGGKGAGFTDPNCTVTDPEGNGVAYGGGGGGGNGIGSPGGIGGGGICIISWNSASAIGNAQGQPAPVLISNPIVDRIGLRNATGTERYELLDAVGKVLWAGSRIQEQDFTFLQAGTYFLRVVDNGAQGTIKVLK
ncbi:MAG: T9SS type A sorting domain-containing protein [Flavobacteriales bacterium]|nr:T9SS type A sorting domain-containing protein [Flavobacteriales bacterium]